MDMGHFHQCLNVKSPSHDFIGQYAMIYMEWPLPHRPFKYESPYIPVTTVNLPTNNSWLEYLRKYHTLFYLEPMVTSICYPSTCTDKDLNQVLNHFNSKSYIKLSIKMSRNAMVDPLEHQSAAKSFCQTIVIGLIMITILSTVVNNVGSENKFLPHFDAINNWIKVTTVAEQTAESTNSLLFFHGIRFYYFVIAVMSHLLLPLSVKLAPIYFSMPFFYVKARMIAASSRISAAHLAMNFVMG